ncbi:MBL fold metallo-hydrolase [Quadrisphaera sp. KR29]|uniref:MBL fold metallo-hydrolase n=1 Tax=Quadrisphaera sp. KR29 TaxID=3461391 RepID=UPI004043D04B
MLELRTVSVGPVDNRSYLLTDGGAGGTGAWLLVDAAAQPERLLALLEEALPGARRGDGLVVTTHRHDDHTGALVEVARATGAATAAGDADADALPLAPDRRLHHGDAVRVGDHELAVTALRGHTPGSVALLLPAGALPGADGEVAHLFTGDSLFPGGPGRTWSPQDFTALMDDLEERVFAGLPDDTVVHPGHGETTTLGAERPRLGEYRSRGW